jgi:ABC-type Fe3+-hydroxamate transport system substrate-binding protein
MANARFLRLKWLLLSVPLLQSMPAFAADRIVALNPMISEWAAEILGKEAALKRIVGSSEFSNYPEYLKSVPTVGPYPNIQVEKVLSLKPDLVIGSVEYNRPDQIEKLRKLKLNVSMLPKEDFSEMESWILKLGELLGEKKKAALVSEKWNRKLIALRSSQKSKSVFFQVQFQPLITVGSGSFLHAVFQKVGYRNIFAHLHQAYPKVSKEAVLERNPEMVFVFEMEVDSGDRKKSSETWKRSEIRFLNGDDFARCSPRLLTAVERMMVE